jgi:predicted transcriptional regulator
MNAVPLRWKLKEVLEQANITPYRFVQESGLSASTVYRITGGRTEGVQGKVLDDILSTLYRLTGKAFGPSDVIHWQAEDSSHAKK